MSAQKKSNSESLAERLERLTANISIAQPSKQEADAIPQSLKKMRDLAGDLRNSMPEGLVPDPQKKSNANSSGSPGTSKSTGRTRTTSPGMGRAGKSKSGSPSGGSPNRRGGDGGGGDLDNSQESYAELLHKYEMLGHEKELLEMDLKRRQESYMRREGQYKQQLDHLKSLLDKAVLGRHEAEGGGMYPLRSLHGRIMEGIGHLQQKTIHTLQEQEKDLLRAFRARLYDVQIELKKEREKKEDGALEWIEKTKTVNKELDWTKEEALRLHKANQMFKDENARLKTQFKSQEDDREFLVRQLMSLKKDNARLRSDLERRDADDHNSPSHFLSSSVALPASPQQHRMNSAPPQRNIAGDTDARYKDVIRRLKKLLEIERRNVRSIRTAHVQELQSRTELEVFLRHAIDHVKAEIARRRSAASKHTRPTSAAPAATPGKSSDVPISEFTGDDRERVMEMLLSQERVINLLYDKTFPPRTRASASSLPSFPDGLSDVAADKLMETLFADDDVYDPLRASSVENLTISLDNSHHTLTKPHHHRSAA